MQTMTKLSNLSRSSKLMLALGTVLFIAACGGGPRGIATLGSDFVRAFNADANSEPVDADDVALMVDPTIDPFNPRP